LDFADEVFVSLFVLVFVRGKEKEGEGTERRTIGKDRIDKS
jgi:hypothetical protein